MKMKKTVLSSLDDLNFQRQIVACKFLHILYHVISNNKTFLGCSFYSLFKASDWHLRCQIVLMGELIARIIEHMLHTL
jgi:hypothetical protein